MLLSFAMIVVWDRFNTILPLAITRFNDVRMASDPAYVTVPLEGRFKDGRLFSCAKVLQALRSRIHTIHVYDF